MPPPEEFSPPLDPGIAEAVLILRAAGVETFESCEGGPGHSFPKPTIRFHGDCGAGYRALGVALSHALPVSKLRHTWSIEDKCPAGPDWELVFWKAAPMPGVPSSFLPIRHLKSSKLVGVFTGTFETGYSREICKSCHHINPVGFTVPDEVWELAVPSRLRDNVLCLGCFVRLADERLISWDKHIEFFPVSLLTHLKPPGTCPV